ncbi:sugar kinase [Rugosimonospora africana]|uniref:Sugar kinase n=1 Tax=Rugosimonospora africana TaxID=556532 RepID=A0A8J3R3V3_9ACTN|nr:sugar kinase [Rugosimonospora africana]GIH21397.1 sugar kinase [Rugosimonospora africana]
MTAPDEAAAGANGPSGNGAAAGRAAGDGGAPADVVTMGETMAMLSTPRIGLLRHAASLDLSSGGAESNLAIGLARLGHRVSWVGRVGADEFGALICRTLAAEGIDCRSIVDPAAPTGLMIKARRTEAVTRVSYYRSGSAGSRLSPQDVDTALVSRARVLYLTGITPALSGTAREAVRYAIDVARRAGVLVCLSLNYRQALWSEQAAGAEFAELVTQADLVFASEAEARLVVGGDTVEDLAAELSALGPRQVLITRGARGALAYVDGEVLIAPAYPVSAVDPVGAGDAFAAGYLSATLDGMSIVDCLDRACLAGAFAVTVPGDWEGLPDRADLALLRAEDAVLR